MKILYVGNFSQDWMSEEYIAKSFEALGHCVKRMQGDGVNPQDIIEESKRGYDFLLYARFSIRGDQEDILKSVGIPKVCWFFDLYPGTIREKRLRQPWVRMADHFFTTDNGHQEFYRKAGRSHRCVRQGIFHGEAVEGTCREELKSKVFFAGTMNPWFPPRQNMIDFLMKTYGRDFKWPRRQVRGMELNDFIASTKITVGNTIYSPHYWSNRIYEMTGRGGFLIMSYTEGMEEEFKDGEHIVYYEHRNYKDLKDKIDYYLKHDGERERIRKAGFEHCRNNFTYKHRCQELLNKIYED